MQKNTSDISKTNIIPHLVKKIRVFNFLDIIIEKNKKSLLTEHFYRLETGWLNLFLSVMLVQKERLYEKRW